MHIKLVKAQNFKRFRDLTVEVPGTPRLVVLAGPNGLGKSSLVDLVRFWHGAQSGEGWAVDEKYHPKAGDAGFDVGTISVEFVEDTSAIDPKTRVYARSAYRHEPDFETSRLTRSGELVDAPKSSKMIDSETKVSDNYQRLISSTVNDLYSGKQDAKTVAALREEKIGEIRDAMLKLFPDLELRGPGDPLGGGTFLFSKAGKGEFRYKNLSGGEKAAFDLILDLVVKREAYAGGVYFIDEPELHLNTRLQGPLLDLLLALLPDGAQLWVATHSIGMMRRAQDLHDAAAADVAFLDFEGNDFDQPVHLTPVKPDREFYARVLDVALGDLAALIAPKRLVLCEGRPVAAPGNLSKAEFDARCYRAIFADEFPDTDFASVGNSNDVAKDTLQLGRTFETIVTGTKIVRVVDRDHRSPQEVADLAAAGTLVLGRRHLESYLFDDAVLTRLCQRHGQAGKAADAIAIRDRALAASVGRGNDPDDMKSAAGEACTALRALLAILGGGNTTEGFLIASVAPCVESDLAVYAELRANALGL